MRAGRSAAPVDGGNDEQEHPALTTFGIDEALETVTAAGAICWRRGPRGLEVLLVHHAVHDDWGWPKGKPDGEEILPVCAAREVAEETGVVVRLGVPLPGTYYVLPDGRPKTVTYWAAEAVGLAGAPAPEEIDDVVWLPLAQARDQLSRASDRAPLDHLAALDERAALQTRPLLLLRNGSSVARADWGGSDETRPLGVRGRAQAEALTALLRCWRPERVISSPWVRCVSTVAPYAAAEELPVTVDDALADHADAREHTVDLMTALLLDDRPTVACLHRTSLAAIAKAARARVERRVRTEIQPGRLGTAEVLVWHVALSASPNEHTVTGALPREIVAVERHRLA